MSTVSVVIPALDEEGALPGVIAETRAAAAQAGRNLELILVDDGSRDSTGRIMEESGGILIRHESPRGCHPSSLDGFRKATGDWVVFFPADGQIPPGVLTLMIQTAEFRGLDVVIGVRARRADSFFRRIVSGGYRLVLNAFLGMPWRDVDSSTLYRREVLQAVLPEVKSDSAAIAAELLLRITAKGGKIGEVEIAHRPRTTGRAKGINLKDALTVPRNLYRLSPLRVTSP